MKNWANLFYQCKGDFVKFKEILNEMTLKDDINYWLSLYFTEACARGYLEIVKYIIEKTSIRLLQEGLERVTTNCYDDNVVKDRLGTLKYLCTLTNRKQWDKVLENSVFYSNFPMIKHLVENNADVANNKKAVFYGCLRDKNILKYLIEHNADVTEDKEYIRSVCEWDLVENMKYLIEQKADVDSECLLRSCGNLSKGVIAEMLIRQGIRHPLALQKAVQNQHFEIVAKILLENGEKITKEVLWNCLDKVYERSYEKIDDGENYTHKSREIISPILKLLIENKGDVQAENNFLLTTSCEKGFLENVKFLVENKADITAQNNLALENACEMFHFKIIKFLVENKADVTANDNSAIKTAMRCYAHYGAPKDQVVKFLIENKADVTDQCVKTSDYSLDMLKYLLEQKADLTSHCDTLLIYHAEGDPEIVKFLVSLNADVTAQNNEALIRATGYGDLETVKFLVENKADVTAQNNQPIKEVSENQYGFDINVVEFLVSKGANIKEGSKEVQNRFLEKKYYKRWRLIHWKKFFRKVILPLYYSPGFPGYLSNKKDFLELI